MSAAYVSPAPLPLAPAVIVIHGTLLVAVQPQPLEVATLTVCAAPAAGAEFDVGETV